MADRSRGALRAKVHARLSFRARLAEALVCRGSGDGRAWLLKTKEQGNINTPLELAIRNQADRFSLAMDAIGRMLRVHVSPGRALARLCSTSFRM